eukprot:3837935-Pleurochrysis_carterae.AAC.1
MFCRDSAEPGPAPVENPLSARLARLGSGTMADPRHFGPPPLPVAMSVVLPSLPWRLCWWSPWPRSRGSVCSPWSSIWSPSAASTALTNVKFTLMPLTSKI